MTIYAVEVEHQVHTCPGNPEPHPVITRRRIVGVTPGRPCLAPITVDQHIRTTIPCGRREPSDRQCLHCRTTITITNVTVVDLGYQGPTR